jgi:hypothetical protein
MTMSMEDLERRIDIAREKYEAAEAEYEDLLAEKAKMKHEYTENNSRTVYCANVEDIYETVKRYIDLLDKEEYKIVFLEFDITDGRQSVFDRYKKALDEIYRLIPEWFDDYKVSVSTVVKSMLAENNAGVIDREYKRIRIERGIIDQEKYDEMILYREMSNIHSNKIPTIDDFKIIDAGLVYDENHTISLINARYDDFLKHKPTDKLIWFTIKTKNRDKVKENFEDCLGIIINKSDKIDNMITVLFIFDLESAKIIQSEIRGNKHA